MTHVMHTTCILHATGCGAKAYLAYQILAGSSPLGLEKPKGPLVFVLNDDDAVEDMADAIKALAPIFSLPVPSIATFGDDARERLASLQLLELGAPIVLTTEMALNAKVAPRTDFAKNTVHFKSGEQSVRQATVNSLINAGYQRVDFVESPGEFAIRGAVLDFHALEPALAYRVLYDEDSIASIRIFDPISQEPSTVVTRAIATPAEELGSNSSISNWLEGYSLWLVPPTFKDISSETVELHFPAESIDSYSDPKLTWKSMQKDFENGQRVFLFSLNSGEDSRMQELLSEEFPQHQVQFLIGPLREGFHHKDEKISVYTTAQIFKRDWRGVGRWKRFAAKGQQSLRWKELAKGDFVVHQDYGIARFIGMEPVAVPGHGPQDCVKLEFRGSDRMYVPLTEFNHIQKFSGVEGKKPRLSSLDRRSWEEVKRQVAQGVRELAEQLLKMQAKRAAQPGHQFPLESDMERRFAQSFPYEMTEDQAKAVSEVLADMTSTKPMDRLVVGDVGYGKTEVAMRAAFKCVMGLKQCVVLTPTTVLADQHQRTFFKRMAAFPVKVSLLTRFQTKAEQKKIIEELKKGQVDIVIGTARLLQKDVRFHDLGLIIVDEEHRFGVADKERLKKMRINVDILSLSATPIPRSLNQALTGLRAISLIETAPSGRQPIITRVGPWDERMVSTALAEEMARGGQAYYVHNRVRSMKEALSTVERLAPGARVAMVHGQMPASEIEKVMWNFSQGHSDILVASTIIESGLDIPTVNTLLVEDAQNFGLAQLYQLRGRIGREKTRAYCYLFYPSDAELKDLSEDTGKRLEALKEFGALGAGIKLALRDLEIRGAGDLLGAKQHGFMNAVGADYYAQMLESEVTRLRGQKIEEELSATIDLRLPAYLPQDYLPGEIERLKIYKRALRASPSEGQKILEELERLSGPAPQVVKNLFDLLALRSIAQKAFVSSIIEVDQAVEIRFRLDAPVDLAGPQRWLQTYGSKLSFIPSHDGDGVRLALNGLPAITVAKDFLLAHKAP